MLFSQKSPKQLSKSFKAMSKHFLKFVDEQWNLCDDEPYLVQNYTFKQSYMAGNSVLFNVNIHGG